MINFFKRSPGLSRSMTKSNSSKSLLMQESVWSGLSFMKPLPCRLSPDEAILTDDWQGLILNKDQAKRLQSQLIESQEDSVRTEMEHILFHPQKHVQDAASMSTQTSEEHGDELRRYMMSNFVVSALKFAVLHSFTYWHWTVFLTCLLSVHINFIRHYTKVSLHKKVVQLFKTEVEKYIAREPLEELPLTDTQLELMVGFFNQTYVQHVRLFLQAFTHPRVDMKQIQAIPYQVPYEEPDLAAYELDDPMPKQPAADYFVEMERLRREEEEKTNRRNRRIEANKALFQPHSLSPYEIICDAVRSELECFRREEGRFHE